MSFLYASLLKPVPDHSPHGGRDKVRTSDRGRDSRRSDILYQREAGEREGAGFYNGSCHLFLPGVTSHNNPTAPTLKTLAFLSRMQS